MKPHETPLNCLNQKYFQEYPKIPVHEYHEESLHVNHKNVQLFKNFPESDLASALVPGGV